MRIEISERELKCYRALQLANAVMAIVGIAWIIFIWYQGWLK